jgi:hypothetical protein
MILEMVVFMAIIILSQVLMYRSLRDLHNRIYRLEKRMNARVQFENENINAWAKYGTRIRWTEEKCMEHSHKLKSIK